VAYIGDRGEQWRILAAGASDNNERAWQELWTLTLKSLN